MCSLPCVELSLQGKQGEAGQPGNPGLRGLPVSGPSNQKLHELNLYRRDFVPLV